VQPVPERQAEADQLLHPARTPWGIPVWMASWVQDDRGRDGRARGACAGGRSAAPGAQRVGQVRSRPAQPSPACSTRRRLWRGPGASPASLVSRPYPVIDTIAPAALKTGTDKADLP
jgi:hypothetical protein